MLKHFYSELVGIYTRHKYICIIYTPSTKPSFGIIPVLVSIYFSSMVYRPVSLAEGHVAARHIGFDI